MATTYAQGRAEMEPLFGSASRAAASSAGSRAFAFYSSRRDPPPRRRSALVGAARLASLSARGMADHVSLDFIAMIGDFR